MTKPIRKPRDPLGFKPQRDILTMIGRYHYVTSRQVTRLLFRESIHNYSQKLLAELTRAGYLTDVNFIPKGKNPGRPEFVWSLTTKGRGALQDLGEPIEVKIPHSAEKSQLFMLHTQAINDTLITAELFAREHEGTVFLSGMEHDQMLQRRAIRVPVASNKPTTVTPDGWVHFTIHDKPGAVLFEIDRGTEDRKAFQLKIRALRTLLFSPDRLYSQHFGSDPVQIAVVVRSTATYRTKGPEKRLWDLLSWTETMLQDKPALGAYFAMTAVDPLTVSPTEFFTGQHWFCPFATTPRCLIPPERLLP